MQLGSLIAALEREDNALIALEALGDIVLFSEVRRMGEMHGESAGEYVSWATRRFATLAGDEAWLSLVGAMERSPDPAKTALERMVRWALAKDREMASDVAQVLASPCACGSKTGRAGER